MLVYVDQLVGRTLGRYELRQLLGQGKLSTVYVAQSSEQNQSVMLTIFTPPQECKGKSRERFLMRFAQEAAALKRLNHPHIVPVYDAGEQDGFPYLITPLGEGSALSLLLKQQTRYTPVQTLALLKQVAAALDYAHERGIVHGALKPAHIILDSRGNAQVAGFGLAKMLEMRGIGSIRHSHPHLFNIAGMFVASPEYIAPEVVQGAPADARSDTYSLGVILFELLSGQPPFSGGDPLEIALQHVEHRMPSLQEVSPDLPVALDLALQRALERDPAHRLPSADKLLQTFERTMTVIQASNTTARQAEEAARLLPKVARTPSVDWLVEDNNQPQHWMGMPTFTSGKVPALGAPTVVMNKLAPNTSGKLVQAQKPLPLAQPTVVNVDGATGNRPPTVQNNAQHAEQNVDLSSWWSTSGPLPAPASPAAGTFKPQAQPPTRPTNAAQKQKSGAKKTSRRKVLVATGSIVAVGAIGVGGFSLLRFMQNGQHNQSATQNSMASNATHGHATQTPARTNPTPQTKAGAQTNTAGTGHQGTVIGNANIATNKATDFVNPGDNANSILVHLSNGNFVAYERACTHQGVEVNYDPATQKLICPRHLAVFDPTNNATVLSGPAPSPLKKVNVRVNADGTVTAV